ncbi:hypothetical protein NL676_028337 [Syzygium grande]|nr:hypothetical protein NL676_028337 [Syzygium grande]
MKSERMENCTRVYEFLHWIGIVLKQLELLVTTEVMKERIDFLHKLGLTIEDINNCPIILGCNMKKNMSIGSFHSRCDPMASANTIARFDAKAMISATMDSQLQPRNGHSAIPPPELEFIECDCCGLAEGFTLEYIGCVREQSMAVFLQIFSFVLFSISYSSLTKQK